MPYSDREKQLQAYKDRYKRRKADPILYEAMKAIARKSAQKRWSNPEIRAEINRKHREFVASESGRAYTKKLLWNRRLRLIAKYGGKCSRCGFTDPRALHMDHVNGNGNADRKSGNRASSLILRLLREPVSTEFQLLCANCNYIKAHENQEWPNMKKGVTN